MEAKNVFRLKNIIKIYGENGENPVHALNDVSVDINRGEFSAIVGPSGSGKTTLLNIMSGLDSATSGSVFLDGVELSKMAPGEISEYRRDHIGLIFQAYNLIPVLSVKENIEYVMLLQGVPLVQRRDRVEVILKEVGLEGKGNRFPRELSGGQQQRVAVARAIVSQPSIILADEPTANLDSITGGALLDLMSNMNEIHGITFVFSTHDKKIMDRAHRLLVLRDGVVSSEKIIG